PRSGGVTSPEGTSLDPLYDQRIRFSCSGLFLAALRTQSAHRWKKTNRSAPDAIRRLSSFTSRCLMTWMPCFLTSCHEQWSNRSVDRGRMSSPSTCPKPNPSKQYAGLSLVRKYDGPSLRRNLQYMLWMVCSIDSNGHGVSIVVRTCSGGVWWAFRSQASA